MFEIPEASIKERVHIDSLKENEHNPRRISKENFNKLKDSITEDLKMMSARPLIVDENNIVLGGNMRLKALRELGIEQIVIDRMKALDPGLEVLKVA